MSSKQSVIVGLSGGVDSSVAAHLLLQQGFAVRGMFMQNWQDDDDDEYCSIKQDSMDAMAVADLLGIDIDLVNFAAEYKDRVFSYFLKEYSLGRTPNPDILCNSEIKFKCFLEDAIHKGAECVATGHYAKKQIQDGIHFLCKADDDNKDQTYFLHRLSQQQLSKALFPLGNLKKPQVREIAAQLKLPTAAKKDSTGICFIGERPFREFLQKYLPTNKGDMKTPDGKVVGEHCGLSFYTIGQRKGLNIGGAGDAWFVAAKDMAKNELIVVQGHNHPLLLSGSLTMTDLSWTLPEKPPAGRYTAKTRYRMQDATCELVYLSDNQAKLIFDAPQWAVTAGQSAVLYDGNICLGGGVIE